MQRIRLQVRNINKNKKISSVEDSLTGQKQKQKQKYFKCRGFAYRLETETKTKRRLKNFLTGQKHKHKDFKWSRQVRSKRKHKQKTNVQNSHWQQMLSSMKRDSFNQVLYPCMYPLQTSQLKNPGDPGDTFKNRKV